MAQPPESINNAIAECLARCYRGTTPLGEMAQFAGELRANGWDDDDIRSVEATVRKLLAGIVSNPFFDNDQP